MKKAKISYFGIIFWLHLILIIIANISPILFSWHLILIGGIILILQFVFLHGCILTKQQFGKNDDLTFYTVYLEMMGFKPNRKVLKKYLQFVHPFVLLFVALVLQVYLKFEPLLF